MGTYVIVVDEIGYSCSALEVRRVERWARASGARRVKIHRPDYFEHRGIRLETVIVIGPDHPALSD